MFTCEQETLQMQPEQFFFFIHIRKFFIRESLPFTP